MELGYLELSAKARISASYANEILGGKRKPSKSLAIHIYRKTGWRHSIIEGLSDDQIDVLETVEPWQSREADAA